MKLFAIVLMFATLMLGCDSAPSGADMPACDTLRAQFLISRCDADHARCGLKSTAPADAKTSGCMMTVVSQSGPEQVECVDSCDDVVAAPALPDCKTTGMFFTYGCAIVAGQTATHTCVDGVGKTAYQGCVIRGSDGTVSYECVAACQ
jgi:hypothetical protein